MNDQLTTATGVLFLQPSMSASSFFFFCVSDLSVMCPFKSSLCGKPRLEIHIETIPPGRENSMITFYNCSNLITQGIISPRENTSYWNHLRGRGFSSYVDNFTSLSCEIQTVQLGNTFDFLI